MSRVSHRGLAAIDLTTSPDDELIQLRCPHGRLNFGLAAAA